MGNKEAGQRSKEHQPGESGLGLGTWGMHLDSIQRTIVDSTEPNVELQYRVILMSHPLVQFDIPFLITHNHHPEARSTRSVLFALRPGHDQSSSLLL